MLREIDEALHIKASFDSLDKVIATQSQNVSSDHKQKQEHRLHAYQNIVAAGSGVFTGFFTYEVGESVLKFIHASQFADDRSLQYWLFTKAGVSASLQGAGQSPAHAPVLPVVGKHTLSPAQSKPPSPPPKASTSSTSSITRTSPTTNSSARHGS